MNKSTKFGSFLANYRKTSKRTHDEIEEGNNDPAVDSTEKSEDENLSSKSRRIEDREAFGKITLKFVRASLGMDINKVYADLLYFLKISKETVNVFCDLSKYLPREGLIELLVYQRPLFVSICRQFVLSGSLISEGAEVIIFNAQRLVQFSSVPEKTKTEVALPAESSIVIARYQESVSWVPEAWDRKIYFYDKGAKHDATHGLRPSSYRHYQQIANVGRESHTYLHHIIENYDNLTDVIYFTQANPFDHSPDFITLVQANLGEVDDYFPLGHRLLTIHSGNVSQYEKNFPRIQEGFDRTFRTLFRDGSDRSVDVPVRIVFSPGAIFAVSRSAILRRPKEFYEKALTLLSYDKNPIEGHSFERLWSLIFSSFPNN
jgi:hypothetical protein